MITLKMYALYKAIRICTCDVRIFYIGHPLSRQNTCIPSFGRSFVRSIVRLCTGYTSFHPLLAYLVILDFVGISRTQLRFSYCTHSWKFTEFDKNGSKVFANKHHLKAYKLWNGCVTSLALICFIGAVDGDATAATQLHSYIATTNCWTVHKTEN